MGNALTIKIKEVFDEPACDKNQSKVDKARKKGCTRQLSPAAAPGESCLVQPFLRALSTLD